MTIPSNLSNRLENYPKGVASLGDTEETAQRFEQFHLSASLCCDNWSATDMSFPEYTHWV